MAASPKPREIVIYKLLSATSTCELNIAVLEMLREGWQLYGNPTCSIAIGNNRTAVQYCQAVVKYD